jgi:hypothetical protein
MSRRVRWLVVVVVALGLGAAGVVVFISSTGAGTGSAWHEAAPGASGGSVPGASAAGSPSGSPSASPGRAPSPSGSASAGTGTGAGARWAPRPGTTWQWQLTTPVDLTVDVPVYDIDGFTNDAGTVQALHGRGRKVICYIEVGAAEDFRPDYHQWPAAVLGKENGWPGERWLDVRHPEVLAPVLTKRFDMCRDKGFDAVEPDLMDGYANDTGFPITAADQLTFNRYVARLAHERGLSVGLKNDVDQVPQLAGDFDFSVDEECFQYHECAGLKPFVSAGKAVFHVEYAESNAAFCPSTKALGFSSMRKNKGLDAARWPC